MGPATPIQTEDIVASTSNKKDASNSVKVL
jgi:hypothetical protein